MTPFLELATHEISPTNRDDIVREFLPKLDSVRDDVEFDLALWSLAQRLAVDTEELLRQIGARWLKGSTLLTETLRDSGDEGPSEALRILFARFRPSAEAPLPGMEAFSVEVIAVTNDRVRVTCEGARRCCSFIEGMARALCEAFGVSLRYIRQPKRATRVLITFNCLAS
ncbi:hypothetical protein [Pelagicoccus sp. SDUM812002]|uniref:hypothetical protein n=1 Tax=Pelagicoccus sp. SDUM812002 TaxID=3041266 RepID=UPI00280C5C87|nr:hypothetical protein [Pelagicoccus sp. SDUM812002]MDQ8184703.1 hypothetical protein [Pelagicoccus sp. SDUM812002]